MTSQTATQNMRIAVASSGLGNVSRGIEIWAKALAAALDARRCLVRLYKGGGVADAPYERVISCWPRHSEKTKRLLKALPARGFWRLGLASPHGVEQTTFTPGLIQCLRRDKIEILHVQDPLLARNIQGARRLGLVKTRVILGHGTVESLEFLKTIEFLQHLAPWHLEEARLAGAWKPTWTAIPNFVDSECFSPGKSLELRRELLIPNNAIIVLTSAAIEKKVKRIDYLIDEFASFVTAVGEMPVYLIVAGGVEPDTAGLVEYGKARLGNRIRFLFNVSSQKMPAIYRSADIFVLCSLKEMMPVALIEAMATGLPSIVHGHPVLEWVVGSGGEIVNMAQKGALHRALQLTVLNSAHRAILAAAARRHCLENFCKDSVVQKIMEYYEFVRLHDRADGLKT